MVSWAHVSRLVTVVAGTSVACKSLVTVGPLANGLPLRIMPLGASITYGVRSSDGNGYRAELRGNLTTGGNPVNMVGSQRAGKMVDNDNEGWPGFVIDQVLDKAKASVPKWMPNVVVVNAGTNDCLQNVDVASAGQRMQRLLEYLYEANPGTTVLLSTLLVNRNSNAEKSVETVNQQYTTLATELRTKGRKLILVDMHGSDGPQLDDMVDGTHPNDYGYGKMALIWYKGLQKASAEGFLTRATDVGIPDNGRA